MIYDSVVCHKYVSVCVRDKILVAMVHNTDGCGEHVLNRDVKSICDSVKKCESDRSR